MRNRSWIGLALLVAAWLCPGAVWAEQVVAVLAFGGDDEGNVRGAVVDPLFNRYNIIHGDKVLDACDELGIPMSRGRNLARCAQRAGAAAVVGGAVQGGKLSLVVFSGKDGQVLVKGSVPCRGRLSSRNLRKALSVVLKGLNKAPRARGSTRRPPPPEKEPSKDFSFDPEPVKRGEEVAGGGQGEDLDEDPLTGTGTPSFDPDGDDPAVTGGGEQPKKESGGAGRTRTSWPALEVALGVGLWSRNFTLNDPAATNLVVGSKSEQMGHPEYKSGAAFLIRLYTKVRPLAFFMEGLATGPFIKLLFQSTAGLQSKALGQDPTSGKPVVQLLATGFWELDFEVGYDWDVFDNNAMGPHVIASLGYSKMNFNIDWPVEAKTIAETKGRLPNVDYSCFLIKVGVAGNAINFGDWVTLGGHFFFDFRPVLGDVGDVEDPTLWYGPATVNGLGMALGIDGRVNISESIKLMLSLEYTYTRYWYVFTEGAARVKNNTRAAGGALDELHGFIVNVGYAY